MKEHLEKIREFCRLHNSGKKEDRDKLEELYGEDVDIEELLNKLPENATWEMDDSFDSPGFDLYTYAVAWTEVKGNGIVPRVELFRVEYF